MSNLPPKWADRFLEWFCNKRHLEIIQGDLHELYKERCTNLARWKCNLLYIKDVLDMVRAFTLRSNNNRQNSNHISMFKNYLKVSGRNFLRNKTYSFINLGGLVIGMVSAIFIILYVQNERSYDTYFPHSENIVRVRHDLFRAGGELIYSRASGLPALAGALKEKLPEVKHATNFYQIQSSFRYKENAFLEDNVLLTDSTFFDVFLQRIIAGDPNKLGLPNTMVISQSTAERYFGTSLDVVKKKLTFTGSETDYEIVALMEDIPSNTHFKADILISNFHAPAIFGRDSNHLDYFTTWGTTGWFTYAYVDAGMEQFVESLKRFTGQINKEHKNDRSYGEFIAQPLDEIYLTSKFRDEMSATNGNEVLIKFLTILAILILVLAWLNYVNLTTARSVERAKEVGLRKVVGSSKSQIRLQFLLESLFYNVIALLFSLGIVIALWKSFGQFVGKPIMVNLFDNPTLWILLISLILIGSVAAGLYPALVIARLKPAAIVGGNYKASSSGILLRKILVTVQFMIAIFLCVGTVASFSQLQFMLKQDKGFDMANLLTLQSPISNQPDADARFTKLINDLRNESLVLGVSSSSGIPGILQLGGRFYKTPLIEESIPARRMFIDEHFLDVFDIELSIGRNFDITRLNDTTNAIIINEQASKAFGFASPKEALGQGVFQGPDNELKIIGIVKDYAQVGYQFEQPPIVFYFNPIGSGRVSIKFQKGNSSQVLTLAKDKFKASFPDSPFQHVFMDEFYNRLFQNDEQFSHVATVFTSLAIIVALLGLIGFVAYAVNQRTQEIGIRKVMGASVEQILILFSKDLLKLITLAGILVIPLVYLAINKWQQSYVLQQSIGVEIYVVPILCIIVIAMLCVAAVSIKTANRNPVLSLRNE